MALVPTASAHHLSPSVQLQLATVDTLTSKPDLYPLLPIVSTSYEGTVPAVFLDTDEIDGKLLYRFDAVIANYDGTLDIICQNCNSPGTRTISQVLWPLGRPPADDLPSAIALPDHTEFMQDITTPSGPGGWMFYSALQGHNHWHYDRAALYELIVPNVGSIPSSKTLAGFCFFDTYGQRDPSVGDTYFTATGAGNPNTDPDDVIPDDEDWCRPGDPTQTLVRMGISPGVGDYYAAQLADQWVDITGVPPGPATLRATVNPDGAILESNLTNNTLDEARVIPGAIANAVTASVAANLGGPVQLSGTVVGPEVPIFLPDAIHNDGVNLPQPCALRFGDCYAPANAFALTFEITSGPTNGTAAIVATNGLTATLQYTPTAGYIGPDTLTYITRDTRGLASAPATITLDVSNKLTNTALPTIGGTPAINAVLTAAPGTWLPEPTSHGYQWQRCNAAGATCANIGGATSKAYTVRTSDIGSTLRIQITAARNGDTGVATSAATTTVSAIAELSKKLQRKLFRGTKRGDTIRATRKHDLIKSGGGADRIWAKAGQDIIKSGNGNDRIYAGKGKDVVAAGRGRDKVWTRDGKRDIVNCGPGFDTVYADKFDKIHRSCEDRRIA
jgi:Ca2+-binding RTX toxin-like protein